MRPTDEFTEVPDKLLPELIKLQEKQKKKGMGRIRERLKEGYKRVTLPFVEYDPLKDPTFYSHRILAWKVEGSVVECLEWDDFVGKETLRTKLGRGRRKREDGSDGDIDSDEGNISDRESEAVNHSV